MSLTSSINSVFSRIAGNKDTDEERIMSAERQSETINSIEYMHRVEALRQQGSYLVHDPMLR